MAYLQYVCPNVFIYLKVIKQYFSQTLECFLTQNLILACYWTPEIDFSKTVQCCSTTFFSQKLGLRSLIQSGCPSFFYINPVIFGSRRDISWFTKLSITLLPCYIMVVTSFSDTNIYIMVVTSFSDKNIYFRI